MKNTRQKSGKKNWSIPTINNLDTKYSEAKSKADTTEAAPYANGPATS